jgi:hypothetical protein
VGAVAADRLLAELDTTIRENVGPVGRLVLRKKARDLGIADAAVDDERANALMYEMQAALFIIMGEDGAARAAARLREKMIDLGLDV